MNEYINPILPGLNPDSSICRVGQDYYLTNSSFRYFPMLPIYHSRDLINWRLVNHGISRDEQGAKVWRGGRNGLFAPTIRYHEQRKKYYIVVAFSDAPNSAQRTFLLTAENPEADWSRPLFLEATDNLDPSLFFDMDGNDYIQYVTDRQDGVYQYRIDLDTGRKLSEPEMIWRGTGGRFPEGAHIFYVNGYYYLFLAEGGIQFGHAECVARSRKINSPYESCPRNPILTHRDWMNQSSPIQCVGHSDLVQDTEGRWWMICLAFRSAGKDRALPLGRETFLAPLEWDDEGWPVVKNPGAPDGTVSLVMRPGREMAEQHDRKAWHDDFDSTNLDVNWCHTWLIDRIFYELDSRPGWLKINGLPDCMNPDQCSPLVCRRQTHFRFTAMAKMEFHPVADDDEAGLTVFNDERRHYEIGLKRHAGKTVVFVRKTIADISSEAVVADYDCPVIYLGITGDCDQYMLQFGNTPETMATGGTGSTMLLSHRYNWSGNMLGPYCVSHQHTPAYFDWIDYKGEE